MQAPNNLKPISYAFFFKLLLLSGQRLFRLGLDIIFKKNEIVVIMTINPVKISPRDKGLKAAAAHAERKDFAFI